MSPPLFRPPDCECPDLAHQVDAAVHGTTLPACPVHQPVARAAQEADQERAHWRAEADRLRGVYELPPRKEPAPPADPLAAALADLTRRTSRSLPLNASAEDWARHIGLPGAGIADPHEPTDN